MTEETHDDGCIDIGKLPPVPTMRRTFDTGDYRDVPVDENSSFYAEELVDLRDYGISGISYYHVADGSNPPYCTQLEGSIPRLLARKSVAQALQKANRRLEPSGLELFVWDAYRPLTTQIGLWKFFEHAVRRENPSLGDGEVYGEIIKFVSDPNRFSPNDPTTWPTHMTGASVDLTIRRKSDLGLLDMGAHFDQMDEAAFSDHFEKRLAARDIDGDDPRLLNRRLLYFVMTEAGFTNYPLEYWHFDRGNQLHQKITSELTGDAVESAVYGVVFANGTGDR